MKALDVRSEAARQSSTRCARFWREFVVAVWSAKETKPGTRKIRDDIQARIEKWCDEMSFVET